MDWWLIPITVGVVVLLWFLWVAAFHPGETVSEMPELDGYVTGELDRSLPARDQPERATATGRPAAEATTESEEAVGDEPVPVEDGDDARGSARPGAEAVSDDQEPGEQPDGAAAADAGEGADADPGIWIELDIEPLFPSSQSHQVVDLTEAEDPEVTP